MNPEQLRKLLRVVRGLEAKGFSEQQITDRLRIASDNSVRSVAHLDNLAKRADITPDEVAPALEDKSTLQKIKQGVTPAIQGALGGFAPDVVDFLDKIGVAAPGAGDRFRENLADERAEHGIRAAVGSAVGLIGGPSGKVLGGLFKGARAVAAPAGPAIARGAQALGAGPVTTRIARIAGAGAAGGATGAIASGAAGAAAGVGEAGARLDPEGRTAAARLKAATVPGAVGAVLGTLGAGGGLLREGRKVLTAGVTRGERLATDITQKSGLFGPAGKRASLRAKDAAKRGLFQGVEAQGARVSIETRQAIFDNPTLLQELKRSGSQEAKKILANEKAFQQTQAAIKAGKPLPRGEAVNFQEPMSFKLVDSIKDRLVRTSKGHARQKVGGVAPDQAKIKEAKGALGILDDTFIAEREGFSTALESASRVGTAKRGFDEGIKTFSKDASAVTEEFGKAVGQEGKEAFREGLLVKVSQRLRGGPNNVKTFVVDAQGSELQTKLKIMLGSERAFKGAMAEIAATRTAITADKTIEFLIKWGGFRFLGSSIAGGAAIAAAAQ